MRIATVVVYLACVLAAIGLMLVSRRSSTAMASVEGLLDVVLADRAVRVTLILFWWWLGWHFLVGQTVDPAIVG
jgi:hypothetical protein